MSDINTQHILQTDITKLLGLDSLSEEEQATFLEDIGDVVMESAIVRLVANFNEEEEEQLEEFLNKEPSSKRLMQHLVSHYPNFEKILTEEIAAFKQEVIEVMPPVTESTN